MTRCQVKDLFSKPTILTNWSLKIRSAAACARTSPKISTPMGAHRSIVFAIKALISNFKVSDLSNSE